MTRPSPQDEFKRIQCRYPILSSTGCTRSFCQSGRMVHTDETRVGDDDRSLEMVEAEAVDFLRQVRRDGVVENDDVLASRISAAIDEIRRTSGIWHQTPQELEHGLRLSWKHARKCIMRSEYSYLKLNDLRHVKTSKEMGQLLVKGMAEAFNRGDIQPSVFVFPPKRANSPGPMVWNQQFLAFAGYRQPDGSVLGDPINASLTDSIVSLGWKPPRIRTRWDLLPLVTMADGDEPFITPVPEHLFPLVRIRHPDPQHALAFDKLGLRWVPAPALSQLGFDIGGVQYTATPFIGWFMDAEIGVRDLADSFRYDALPSVASALKLLKPGQELDELSQFERLAVLSRAQIELNLAVHSSFSRAGVRMSDSLTASAMYSNFDDQHLAEHGFRLPADPYWLAPPQGSIIPIWHRGGAPNYQPKPMICRLKENPVKVWKRLNGTRAATSELSTAGRWCGRHVTPSPPIPIRVFYCSSGTTAQRLAVKLEQRLRLIADRVIASAAPLRELEVDSLSDGDVIFIVASCAGRGDVPTNGQALLQRCNNNNNNAQSKLAGVSFCIFGNGNSSYGSNFNGAAAKLEAGLKKMGLSSAVPTFEADTLKEDPPWRQFQTWLAQLEAKYGDAVTDVDDGSYDRADDDDSTDWLLSQLSPAKVLSVRMTSKGDIRRLALDVGGLEYSHMSHVDVFVPLSESEIDELLMATRLTGEELALFGERTVNTRQFFSLLDPEKPFKSVKWASKLALKLTEDEESWLLTMPMAKSIRDMLAKRLFRLSGSALFDFMRALPIRRSRTFSTASSQLYWNTRNMGNVLELTLKTHPGGLVTDHFVSGARRGDRLYIRIRHGPGAFLVNDDKPLIAFTTGSGIAPLRGLLQAKSAIAADCPRKTKGSKLGKPLSLFLAFKKGDAEIIDEAIGEARALDLVDMLHLTPSNPSRERAQDRLFVDGVAERVRSKIRDEGASVFVCASKEAADDFATNLEAIVGVDSIRQVLGERWVEEVYVCAVDQQEH
ncbi:hypothetical protein L249_5101 [Ophiocordyceps polyrhachis-furcata BCC 54312]|uniref:nitric-oxide synthase (NADPH) n=1 Tax=Ophiocordyceps polyrhachis-furcata BCC 54312 TaxID=1330021 RepID=A0A367L3T6_9HYPO|nr:hypothetical protein L249_5101 [Ophiocordyceps polyrhachis-furcata BCC 54312]